MGTINKCLSDKIKKSTLINNKIITFWLNNWHGNIFGVYSVLNLVNKKYQKILAKLLQELKSVLTTIFLAHKEVGGGRLSSHTIKGSIHTSHRLIWYNHGITVRRLFMSKVKELEAFKVALGNILDQYPDKPPVPGYTTPNDNYLLDLSRERGNGVCAPRHWSQLRSLLNP